MKSRFPFTGREKVRVNYTKKELCGPAQEKARIVKNFLEKVLDI